MMSHPPPGCDERIGRELSAKMDFVPERARVLDERLRLIRDGVVNYSATLASAVTAFVLVPIMLRNLRAEQYGLWVAAMSVLSIATSLDLGLGLAITREIAAGAAGARKQTAAYVNSCGSLLLLLAAIGAMAAVVLALPFAAGLSLGRAQETVAREVFVICAIAVFLRYALGWTRAVLHGIGRFDLDTTVSVLISALWAAGVIVLLHAGLRVRAIAAWFVAVNGIGLIVATALLRRVAPQFTPRIQYPPRLGAGSQMRFAMLSQLAMLFNAVAWEGPILAAGLVLGARNVVPYYIGLKYPLAISLFSWSVGTALFPAASRHPGAQDGDAIAMRAATALRWIMVCALPGCVTLMMIAPDLLAAWLGAVPPGSVRSMRLLAVAVAADAAAVAPLHVLWALGDVNAIAAINCGMAAIALTVAPLLAAWIGITGVAWSMLIAMSFAAVAFSSRLSCRDRRDGLEFLLAGVEDLWPALAACGTAVALTGYLFVNLGWVAIAARVGIGAIVYGVVAWFYSAHAGEREAALRAAATARRFVSRAGRSLWLRTISSGIES
jgi:O-antigen/teichoic acid export membrane protein